FAFRIKTTDGTPATAPLNPDDVRWLLDAPADEVVLSPGRQTRLRVDDPAETEESPAEATIPVLKKRRTKIVSAGRHLHDYFEQHKQT
ncbi:MAG TPA: hypothetical protein VKD71_10525, partial [Gemmataceae bacterium]|nr:hypothetical protein [Gemmataceae bacterium]